MARPSSTTPIETVLAVLRAMIAWAATHKNELNAVFGQHRDIEQRATELAADLDENQVDYTREKREDVGLTNRRNETVQQAQSLVASALSLATITFGDRDDFADIKNDFTDIPPSHIRSAPSARRAMSRLSAALDIHGDAMRDELANVDALEQNVEKVSDELDELANERATETAETAAARRKRQAVRLEAVTFIRDAQLAAEAIEFLQPEVLEQLHAIFDAHVPDHRRTATEEDEINEEADSESSDRDDGQRRESA